MAKFFLYFVVAMMKKRFEAFELFWYAVVQNIRKYLAQLLNDQFIDLNQLLDDISKYLQI